MMMMMMIATAATTDTATTTIVSLRMMMAGQWNYRLNYTSCLVLSFVYVSICFIYLFPLI
jgi:hypothetical protein